MDGRLAVVKTDAPIITLTTDFGIKGNFVGILKGIIIGINKLARLIDVGHTVPSYNIQSGRYLLETSYRYFPSGSIHLAVVDPGVGTRRNPVLIETDSYFFIGPDNGLFTFLKKKDIKQIIIPKDRKYFLGEISPTFHGRDIFAPVAGYLSLGISPSEFGPKISNINRLHFSNPRKTGVGLVGSIIHIDNFGNIVTSFQRETLPRADFTIFFEKEKIGRLKRSFTSAEAGRPAAYINSFGYLEIGINCGSAAEYFSADCNSKSKILIASSHKEI
jgi:S-adenosylmethionine hydrolase